MTTVKKERIGVVTGDYKKDKDCAAPVTLILNVVGN
jgi:hypothetical protein